MSSGPYYDIISWSGDVVLWFFWWGRKEKGKLCNFKMGRWAVHSPAQPMIISHYLYPPLPPSLPFLSPSLPFTSPGEDHAPLSSHNTMKAWCCWHRTMLSVIYVWAVCGWLKMLDSGYETAVSQHACGPLVEWFMSTSMLRDTFREGSFFVECQRVTVSCPLQQSSSYLRASIQRVKFHYQYGRKTPNVQPLQRGKRLSGTSVVDVVLRCTW